MKVPTRIPTRPAEILPLLLILPPKTDAAAAPEPLAPPTAMPVRPVVIAPLLVMPPVKSVTFATRMPAFDPAEIVPLLKMLPSNVEMPHEQPTSMP